MINSQLLKQILKSAKIEVEIEDIDLSDIGNELGLSEKEFLAEDYSLLIKIREYEIGFTNRLMHSYSKPIQDLEIFIEICKSIGINIHNRIGNNKTSKFITLKRLHQKSCLLSSEIIYLIKGGYASAALARWRTLLETSIVSLFLALNNDELSEKYLDYEIIERKKELNSYLENIDFLGFEKIDLNIQQEIENEYSLILNKYGKNFKNDYGWASKILKKEKPNLHDFINYLNLEYIKPFYKFSNNYVHSGTKSLMFNIGTINGLFPDDTLTASSNIGFTDPAQLCLLSMFNSTLAFLSLNSDEKDLLNLISLYLKINSIAKSFNEIENKIIEDELNN
ncbi:DUF5677 domain-containing protein [Aliarcobacter butzleri]|uniref:DUF5677 domain-containing protein n=1 Tax=Aliarcobacter butzleri TaxID=28197 RepID=UPI00063AE341|nr:DUF5677 domain-containing protein [Aliarcobacter butzleri]KLE08960.1 hypothetical protein AF79_07040 [Aliarcobacter butzleri L354]MCT7589188.1 DUF5677 domain-containing protein [Aliarcobacter butzleri]MDN5073119.1 DUF5677 domain-containing protein [Aliarcobacter butzleri]MDN5120351.1 DUF5677 domain-containing protein [Aliarcobacter butzleri]MDN5130458.1 DUF5677 domain-containing protein [Aliarcobacter butzleri]